MTTAAGWEKWGDWLSEHHRDLVRWIIDNTRITPGMSVLDLAAGTGLPAIDIARTVGTGGRVVATDVAADMLAGCERRARAANVKLDIRELDMHDLRTFADASFDAVTCCFALMFSSDPRQVLEGARRVLRPGGRVAVAVWDEPAKNAYFTTMFGALGVPPPPSPNAPGPFALAAPGALERAFHAAGFRDVTIESMPRPFEFESLDQYFEISGDLAPPLNRALTTMSDVEVKRLRDALGAALAPYRDGDRLRIPATALCAVATK